MYIYTVRFPFEMRHYVKDSTFSFFVECCALVYKAQPRKKCKMLFFLEINIDDVSPWLYFSCR